MEADRPLVLWKRGDQQTAKGKEAKGVRNMFPVCLLTASQWPWMQEFYNKILGKDTNKLFLVTEMNKNRIPDIMNWLKPKQGKNKYSRSKELNIAEFAKETNHPELVQKVKTGEGIPIINGTEVSEKCFDAPSIKEIDVPDIMATTGGTHLIGPGETLVTWAAGFADLGNLTDNLEFQLNDNVTETAKSLATETFTGYTFTCTNNSKQEGNTTAGYVTTLNHNQVAFDLQHEGGTVDFGYQYLKRTGGDGGNQAPQIYVRGNVIASQVDIHDNILDGNSQDSRGIYMNDISVTCDVWRNIVRGFDNVSIYHAIANTSNRYENNLTDGGTYGFLIVNSATFANNVCLNASTASFGQPSNGDGYNNADDDGSGADGNWNTGSGNEPNITAATEFRSQLITSALYYKVVYGGTLYNNGRAAEIPGNTTGNRGNAAPNAKSELSIGPDNIGSITVTAPNGGESWEEGTTQDITWTSENIDGTLTIDYSSDSGGTYPTELVTGTADDGTYEWTIAETPNTASRVRIEADNDTGIIDASNADFEITSADIPVPPRTAKTFIGDKRVTATLIGDGRVAETMIGDKREEHTYIAGSK